uniref:Potassium channel subfamily K member 18 (inferred by orthology to a human protein) n=1 Tax=Strongyloides venezuelensis TaxID=75913 RepID=A0A0K0FN97_STRVS
MAFAYPGAGNRFKKKNTRACILVVTTFAYLIWGSLVFTYFEEPADEKLRKSIASDNLTLQQKYNFSHEDFMELENLIVKSLPYKYGTQWNFPSSFFFCILVITTIGYGHSTPLTIMGKTFCMFYAIAGIPLGLVMFQSIGERINTFIKFSLTKLSNIIYNVTKFRILKDVSEKHLIFTSLSMGTLVMIFGTFVFHKYENWNLLDGYYCTFITLSTIGFGDFVPMLHKKFGDSSDIAYIIFTLLFIMCGLAIFSACVNLLVLGFMASNYDIVTAASKRFRQSFVYRSSFRAMRRLSRRPSLGFNLQKKDKIDKIQCNADEKLRKISRDRRKTIHNMPTHGKDDTIIEEAKEEIRKHSKIDCPTRKLSHLVRFSSCDNIVIKIDKEESEIDYKEPSCCIVNGPIARFKAHIIHDMKNETTSRENHRVPFSVRRLPNSNIEHLILYNV